jgi:hypothetical protein
MVRPWPSGALHARCRRCNPGWRGNDRLGWGLGHVDRVTKRLSAARRCNASIACLGYRSLRTVCPGRSAGSRPPKNRIHPEISFDGGATRERMIAGIKQIHLQASALVVRELISRKFKQGQMAPTKSQDRRVCFHGPSFTPDVALRRDPAEPSLQGRHDGGAVPRWPTDRGTHSALSHVGAVDGGSAHNRQCTGRSPPP